MVGSRFPSPQDITLQEFRDALAKYDQLIEAVSASKGGMEILGTFSPPILIRRLISPQPNLARRLLQS